MTSEELFKKMEDYEKKHLDESLIQKLEEEKKKEEEMRKKIKEEERRKKEEEELEEEERRLEEEERKQKEMKEIKEKMKSDFENNKEELEKLKQTKEYDKLFFTTDKSSLPNFVNNPNLLLTKDSKFKNSKLKLTGIKSKNMLTKD